MIDILARAAFERFSTDTGQAVAKIPSRYSHVPTTWDRLPPHLQELWREVARAVLLSRERLYASRKYSPQQIKLALGAKRP